MSLHVTRASGVRSANFDHQWRPDIGHMHLLVSEMCFEHPAAWFTWVPKGWPTTLANENNPCSNPNIAPLCSTDTAPVVKVVTYVACMCDWYWYCNRCYCCKPNVAYCRYQLFVVILLFRLHSSNEAAPRHNPPKHTIDSNLRAIPSDANDRNDSPPAT